MRKLKKEEYELLKALLKDKADVVEILIKLPDLMVEEMDDGGMGSLRFYSNTKEHSTFGKQIAEMTLLDADNVPVSFSINLDKNGQLFELDVFKADFSKLKVFPRPPFINDAQIGSLSS